jgi:SAM-dependent methyltransferase
MKNISEWKPTKIKLENNKFYVNVAGIASGSLYITMEAFHALDSCKSYLRGHLVDLGCGNVPYFEWYKEQVEEITCVDWPGTLHSAKHIDVFADLNQALPLTSESVDCVLLTSVLEHISEPQILLKEIRRILKKDGHLVLSVPFLYHLHEEPFDYYRYTPHGLKYLAKETGLEIIKVEHYGSAFGVLVDISSKIVQSMINTISSLFPKYLSIFWQKLGNKILRWYQKICFVILQQKPLKRIIERLNMSHKLASGYIVICTRLD